MEWLWKIVKEITKGIFAFVTCSLGVWGYYPLLPAYFAISCLGGKPPALVVFGAMTGIVTFMPLNAMIRYFFILLVIGLGIRIFIWLNRSCDSMSAGIIAGISVIAIHFAGTGMWLENTETLFLGICEGILVLGISLGLNSLLSLPFRADYQRKQNDFMVPKKSMNRTKISTHRMESLAYAVSGISDMLFAMSYSKGTTEQESSGGDCGDPCMECDGREICWKEHHGMELKKAWDNRMMENRYVMAQQLDAMAELMQEWTKIRVYADPKYGAQLAAAVCAAKERGFLMEEAHVYEEDGRVCVEACVSARWQEGIPVKHYVKAIETAFGRDMRTGRDMKNTLVKEGTLLCLYEDVTFYVLQGQASEMKYGSEENGDYAAFYSADEGDYHICLSDGMGSGSKARQESEMVVELMLKFIEAGFGKERALKLMNSAMVLQGEENSYSTLDYAVINLYSGEVELVKIGGAATFLKQGDVVECIDEGSLPAGADAKMEIESVKRQLSNGDFLVMITDGVIEYLHVRNPKEVMIDMISRAKMENAQGMAEYLMTQVMILSGGFPKDDMTILVTGIWEK